MVNMFQNEIDVWFSSDFHFGHTNILKYCDRPFDDVMDMNQGLISRWNENVKLYDIGWIIGDVAMGNKQKNLAWLSKMNGIKYLVMGNHDPGFGKVMTPDLLFGLYQGHFQRIYEDLAYCLGPKSQRIHISHFPYSKDERHDERYAEHRPQYEGRPLIHGHVHDLWKVNTSLPLPQINVGVDVWDYRPVHISTIREIINL